MLEGGFVCLSVSKNYMVVASRSKKEAVCAPSQPSSREEARWTRHRDYHDDLHAMIS
jgi:hypothetical protein